ncbi:Fpg/Nei family DNA glycosylase [Auraticoccus sp. F435]|uniref:DNA-(apurinic or apyrimidinic site) lyase n=1 Tax=Auraticoccus cholistanensis TaxID=2656650 RepID=A0A6A9UXY9_9ACTN|nr:DNA-formamidopyrimidine glycosylase family protein [Auraticoccus cholistanensis]MVA76267.1 Fpg/Nei family DNA glycosylase [Auraticoccus cholistanensis]
MPEGHTLRRLADELQATFAGDVVRASSPQGRFAESAALLDGSRVLGAEAAGKHLLVDFEGGRLLHVHLGLYGKFLVLPTPATPPVGQVRLRIESQTAFADLRGPTACELWTPAQEAELLARLGPDPLRTDADPMRAWQRIRRSATPIGALLMDQSVLAGVGNVYRAEILFRHGLHPLRPGLAVRRGQFLELWQDLVVLMADGVRVGRIETVRPEHLPLVAEDALPRYVYRRTGEACLLCGRTVLTDVLVGRNLYWCPRCQPAYRGTR